MVFIALFYSISPYQVYSIMQGANAPFAAKVVVSVKHTMITYIEVQCCTVDDTVHTVKYCKTNKQSDDSMWLYFSRMTRRPSEAGRQRLFTQQQELTVVGLVRADNAIRLHQLRKQILADRRVFNNINHVSITTIRRILEQHSITMKQLYRVPFERTSDGVKGLRAEYVRRISAMDGAAQPHEFIFIDEAGFDLCETRRRGCNVIGQRAIVHVPGQRGGNITLCAAICLRGLLHHHAKLGPYNSQHILTFLDALHDIVVQNRPDQPRFVVIWDDVSFHRLL
ncbi:uncharacterized protein LOC121812005 [Haplochromis burtoni]|uniref:uncharacterized protein LOC121812005 n=1 Tax=Haplochromis burtoni TaxID=8153 RepID=UPI001C2CEB5A|nr:uncharacterized protein LOC121812005 [Haplochromis burtoni]